VKLYVAKTVLILIQISRAVLQFYAKIIAGELIAFFQSFKFDDIVADKRHRRIDGSVSEVVVDSFGEQLVRACASARQKITPLLVTSHRQLPWSR